MSCAPSGSGGVLAGAFKGYEPRPGQIEMARTVDAAIQNENHLLVEAPTGTGKSIAYSVPAVFHAAHHGKQVLIATANIALQEQLVEKDLPLLDRILPWSFSFALLKGRNNYLCRRRCSRTKTDRASKLGLCQDDDAQLDDLLSWAEQTDTGDVSELAFQPAKELWRLFSTSSDECVGKECKYRGECFGQRARAAALAADILVVNYSLLFAHLSIKEATDLDLVLPPFGVAILDEAHQAAEIARNFFGYRVSIGSVLVGGPASQEAEAERCLRRAPIRSRAVLQGAGPVPAVEAFRLARRLDELDLFGEIKSEDSDVDREEMAELLLKIAGGKEPSANLELVINTVIYKRNLKERVYSTCGSDDPELKERIYQRIKRQRLRTLTRLKTIIQQISPCVDGDELCPIGPAVEEKGGRHDLP